MSDYVSYELRDGAARITLVAGDKGNAVHPAMVAELQHAVSRARADSAAVTVLSSTGRFFSVGGDLAGFADADDVERHIDDLASALHRAVTDLMRSESVVVSLVQGTAAGAGFPLAMAADLVLAAESAKFTLGYTRVGLSIDGGASLLTHTIGMHRALKLALLNEVLTAEQAHGLGLVAAVHPDDSLADAGERLVQQLAAGPAYAQTTVKRLIRDAADPAPERALQAETTGIRSAAVSPDGREGVAAFLAKRPAAFGTAT